MSISLFTLLDWLQETLQPERFHDYCPNGLQVEGRSQVRRLATGVTANQDVLDQAIAWGADAILVHHGYFWKGEAEPVVGMKRRRLAALLANDVSLIAYHLPLDAHPVLGNNARLGQLMGVSDSRPLQPQEPASVGTVGTLSTTAGELRDLLQSLTARRPLLIGEPERRVKRVAWCTGAAQSYIGAAVTAGADVFVTGEVSEPTVHTAREEGIAFIAAGHHATERYGVQAVGEALAGQFPLEHCFFDSDNPV
ncbi:Nif3-like dinuclear metal center hexameric protein [Pseudohalioglobus lutimaris]|uniref:Nif3-like dinuclear metal center hexameric protein n=1 Tax=Pseudohalioglobus lutimaris TaxID=1737061 RepID=A0A2N5X665_9GAMM|nr:Nif3-like dinuclear metal center hexameric protein [Pseudohalioglobus lutimaris]PLW69980.1 Nif3-like dinuclear metal center hexameric protein [Pseudohalioglobus lutimaris]